MPNLPCSPPGRAPDISQLSKPEAQVQPVASACAAPFVLALGGANLDIAASAPVLQAAESNPGRIRCAPGGVARNVA